jgi:hypothetical protein
MFATGADLGATPVGDGLFSAAPLSPEQATISNKVNKTLKVLFILDPFSFNEYDVSDNIRSRPKRRAPIIAG